MSDHNSRCKMIGRAMFFLQVVSRPGWHSFGSVAEEMNVTQKTIRRWINAAQEIGLCVQFENPEGRMSLFRLERKK